MTTHFRQRTRLGLIAAACIFIAIGVGVVFGAQRLIADATQVAHTHEVIGTLESLEARLRDAEATQRGYLLTGNLAYLVNYRNAHAALPEIRDKLFELVHDNPAQTARSRALWATIEHRLGQTARTLERYRTGGLPAAQAAINQDVINASTSIRQQVAAINDAEHELLIQRGQSTRDSANLLRALALLGIPIGILVIWTVYRMLVEEIRRRAQAEVEAARANDQLRIGLDRVQQGRAELQALNRYGSMLQSCTAPEEALQLTRDLLKGLLPGIAGGIYRIRNSQDHAELAADWGVPPVALPAMIAVGACWALRRGQSHSATSAYCMHLAGTDVERTDATMCVPLVAHGAQLGLLTLADAGDEIDTRHGIIQAAAEQLSMALANLSLQDRLRQQSIRDPLSGLFNRRYLEESASRELTRCARRDLPLSLLMLDIDHFKSFNDVHGHAGGDAVLAQFGKLLQAMSRSEDIACRYGGEEFTLILPEADLDAAHARAEAIRVAVEAMHVPHLGNVLPQVTVSIGLACFPAHGQAPEALMRAADDALYRAKRAGRNRVEVATGTTPVDQSA